MHATLRFAELVTQEKSLYSCTNRHQDISVGRHLEKQGREMVTQGLRATTPLNSSSSPPRGPGREHSPARHGQAPRLSRAVPRRAAPQGSPAAGKLERSRCRWAAPASPHAGSTDVSHATAPQQPAARHDPAPSQAALLVGSTAAPALLGVWPKRDGDGTGTPARAPTAPRAAPGEARRGERGAGR